MARIIPKNTKINSTIFKNLTLWDFVAGGVYLLFLGLIVFSDLPGKGFIAIFSIVFAAPMFAPMDGGGRLYNNLGSIIEFSFAKKEFSGKDVKRFVPYTSIREDGLIAYPSYFGKVVSVGQIEFSLLEEYSQDQKISIFERVIKLIDEGSSLDIVKIDRPLNLDAFSSALFKRVEEAADPVKRDILKARIEQIDRINNLDKQYRPFFYLVFYGNIEKNLLETVQLAVSALKQCEIGGAELNAKETVNFLKYCHTRFFDEREIDGIAPDKYIDYIVPKKLKFTGRGYKVDDINAFTFAAVYLAAALRRIEDKYDYCVIDTSPSLSVVTVNALAAAERVIVPIKPEEASLKGVELLLETIESMKALNAEIAIAGFLITMHDKRRKSSARIIEKICGIAEPRKIPVFKSRIRSSASGAALSGNPFLSHTPAAADYTEFIEEFIDVELSKPPIV
ncbi:MAG: ParA family protein [Clostridiales bacterium]|jgi:cellulose biosynthesis protein BcsQ|nr:ParA family protein [Clostridiales bacterium]